MKSLFRTFTVVLAAAFLLPALASAAEYPPPSKPGLPKPRPGGSATLKVCKKGCAYKTIQAAVNAARSGDTVKIADGTYKEGVKIEGAAKTGIKLVGNVKNPTKVFINATGQLNGVIINSANKVTLQGISTRGYVANGFFAANVDGYTMDRLLASGDSHAGDNSYGLFAFNSVGGTITNSEANYNTDAGFYVGQTPVQTKPKRTIVRNISSWGNVLGWSGTNMRYVTITKSKFFNNATGVVPNALTSELYPPEEDNVIADNDIYWNNFNYVAASPFPKVDPSAGGIPYPVGIGVLVFGGRRQTVSKNRVFGNWGVGIGLIEQLTMDKSGPTYDKSEPVGTEAWKLVDNRVTDNVNGNGGKDLNGRDLFYDGSGSGNCFSRNNLSAGVESLPAFSATAFPACNAAGAAGPANTFNQDAQDQAVGWALALPIAGAPGGTITRSASSVYKGTKPFPKASGGAWSVWNKRVPVPKHPW